MRVVTLGTFDMVHVGHINLLRTAALYSHELIVGVNTDRFVTQYKGRPPVMPEQDRCRIVDGVKGVSRTLLNDGPGRELIEQIRPHVLAIGTDWHRRDYLAQIGVNEDWLEEHRIGVLYLPYTVGVSSTQLRAAA